MGIQCKSQIFKSWIGITHMLNDSILIHTLLIFSKLLDSYNWTISNFSILREMVGMMKLENKSFLLWINFHDKVSKWKPWFCLLILSTSISPECTKSLKKGFSFQNHIKNLNAKTSEYKFTKRKQFF